jgi:hypothetical protein
MSVSGEISEILLSGGVVCIWKYKKFYNALQNDTDTRDKVENCLMLLDRKLMAIDSNLAYFAVHRELNQSAESEAKMVFTSIVHTIQPMLQWMQFLAKASSNNIFVSAGDTIEFATLIVALQSNQSLQADLESILINLSKSRAAVVQKSHDMQLTQLLNILVDQDILWEIDKKAKKYQFTGKLELIQSCLEFIVERQQIEIETYKPEPGELW